MNLRTFAGPRRQSGAVTVYVIAALTALLTGAFMAFEVGRIYLANRTLQKMASLAALDAVREVSACDRELGLTAAQVQTNLQTRINESLLRNGGTDLFNDLSLVDIDTGVITSVESARGGTRREIVFTRNGLPIPADDAEAVRVTLRAPFPGFLTQLFQSEGSAEMEVSATAEQPLNGTFNVGSGLVSLNEGALNSLLSGLVGGNVALSLVDYRDGLAKVNVSVEALATALDLSVADLSNLLALSTATPLLSDTLDGLADGLSGSASESVRSLLRQLADATTNTNPIPLEDVIGSLGDTAADAPVINLLDLIMALAQAANADPDGLRSPIQLTNFGVSLAGAEVRTFLRVLQPAQVGSGRPGSPEATARTAQVALMVRIDGGPLVAGLQTTLQDTINAALGLLSLVGINSSITIPAAALKIGIDVEVAQGAATLDRIQCPRAGVNDGNPIAELSASTGLASVNVGTFNGNASSAPALIAGSNFPLATVSINATNLCPLGLCILPINLGQTTLTAGLSLTRLGVSATGPNALPLDVTEFEAMLPTNGRDPTVFRAIGSSEEDVAVPGNPQTVGSATGVTLNLGLSTSQTGSGLVGGLSGLVSSLVNNLNAVVNGLLSVVNGLAFSLIDPLLGSLGVQTGTATVMMQTITVDRPVIVSTQRPSETATP